MYLLLYTVLCLGIISVFPKQIIRIIPFPLVKLIFIILYNKEIYAMTLLRRCSLLIISCMPLTTHAEVGFYGGASVGYTLIEYATPSSNLPIREGNNAVIQVLAGYFINSYLSLEARYGTALKRENNLIVNNLYSGYIKGNLPVNERTSVYGLLGASSVEIDDFNFMERSSSGFSFGFGVHYAFDSNSALTMELISTPADSEIVTKMLSLGLQYRF